MLIFARVISFFMTQFRDETSCISRHMYGSFCKRMGSCCCLKLMFWDFSYVVDARGYSFDLVGHPMITNCLCLVPCVPNCSIVFFC